MSHLPATDKTDAGPTAHKRIHPSMLISAEKSSSSQKGEESSSATLQALRRKRESLRNQEERFEVLMKSTAQASVVNADELKMLKTQLQNLETALRDSEERNRTFIQQLKSSKRPDDQNTKILELQDEIQALKEQVVAEKRRAQSGSLQCRIDELEVQTRTQRQEISRLNDSMEDRLRTIVGLEIDLETHNLKFTDYAKDQAKLEERALNKLLSKESMSEDILELEKQHGCPIKELVAKLLAEKFDLEARFKEEKAERTIRMMNLENENKLLSAKVSVLEQQIETETSKYPLLPPSSYLVQQINRLEGQNLMMKESNTSLTQRLEAATKDHQDEMHAMKETIRALKVERKAEQQHVAALESELTSKQSEGSQRQVTDTIRQIKEHVIMLNGTIAGLVAESKQQHLQLIAIRSEAVEYQLKKPPPPVGLAEFKSDDQSGLTEAESEDISSEQLQELRKLLMEKEVEAANQRKRFKDREAELLAVIQEQANAGEDTQPKDQIKFFI